MKLFGVMLIRESLMWSSSRCFYSSGKSKIDPLQERRMIDRFKIHVRGGHGGNGCTSFRRSRHDRHGRPDGGDGGRGGDVILECSSSVWDFSSLHHHINGNKAGHGTSKCKVGSRGEDKTIYVPVGTVLHLIEGTISGTVTARFEKALYPWDVPGPDSQPSDDEIEEPSLREPGPAAEGGRHNFAELTEERQRIVVASGGGGGVGNGNGARREGPVGEGGAGSEAVIILELKSIADVGFVGMPNAGKSTLLGAVSRARPLVGDYAFTTLRPNMGNLSYDDLRITVADIPGIVSGAHENRGLGHAFLRHIERTKVLAYVVDLAAGIEGGLHPWEQLRELMSELELYCEGLSRRPALVVANKTDEPGTGPVLEELRRRVRGAHVFPVCAVLEEGVPDLREGLRTLVGGAAGDVGPTHLSLLEEVVGEMGV